METIERDKAWEGDGTPSGSLELHGPADWTAQDRLIVAGIGAVVSVAALPFTTFVCGRLGLSGVPLDAVSAALVGVAGLVGSRTVGPMVGASVVAEDEEDDLEEPFAPIESTLAPEPCAVVPSERVSKAQEHAARMSGALMANEGPDEAPVEEPAKRPRPRSHGARVPVALMPLLCCPAAGVGAVSGLMATIVTPPLAQCAVSGLLLPVCLGLFLWGLMWPALALVRGRALASVICAVAFACVAPYGLPTVAVGAAASWLRSRTGSAAAGCLLALCLGAPFCFVPWLLW